MSPVRVLLFGASGFLGGHIAEVLEDDQRVAALIRVGRGDRDDPDWVSHDLVKGSATDLDDLLDETKPDVVINAAGLLSGSTVELLQANVAATATLLDVLTARQPAARLVVLGSAAEYGAVPPGVPVAEDHPCEPVAEYGVTRLASTQLIRLAARERRLDAVALRIFNPIGPGVPSASLLGRAVASMRTSMARGDESITLGPLGAHRDFVDVRDVASAVRCAALVDSVREPVLNVGSGRAVLAREVIEQLADVAGFGGRVHEADAAPTRSRAVNWIAADLTKARRELGWSPTYELTSSIRASWHR